MLQFLRAKEQYPDAIVFFRLGDFYEMFFDDAVKATAILDIALTSRGKGPDGEKIPMAGIPHHAAAAYLTKLLDHGEKVAICEQMADASSVKGVVPREVVRIVTPGLCLDTDSLDAKTENLLVAIGRGRGLAALEFSTGSLRACEVADDAALLAELARLEPAEMLLPQSRAELIPLIRSVAGDIPIRVLPDDRQNSKNSTNGPPTIELDPDAATDARAMLTADALEALTLVLEYAQESQPGKRPNITRVLPYNPSDHLQLDEVAIANLEIVRTLQGERKGSLLHLLDHSKTSMGARALRRRLLTPLTDVAAIRRRHDAVEAFLLDAKLRTRVRETLASVGDLERMTMRAALGLATPRDLGVIRNALVGAEEISEQLKTRQSLVDDPLGPTVPTALLPKLRRELEKKLVSDPPVLDRNGGIIAVGVDADLDELRTLSSNAKDVVLDLERRERERTGIQTLKIKFTRVFGYYIEITRSKLAAVPPEYVRKQTVANAERFVTEELQTLQDKILTADERSQALESALFADLRAKVASYAVELQQLSRQVAALDVHANFAEMAHAHGYIRPEIDESLVIDLKNARHPVVEAMVARDVFVPNNLYLDAEACRLMLLTGPNMSGKSTAMRQSALAIVMAQAGSFVAAESATIGVVDRVFTRVGASDNLAQGDSTFMVEMSETSTILREATRRSLVILDEIGRGTSSHDGQAIAQAVLEYLHDVVGCRAVFSTHYHALCSLADALPHAANFNVAATEHKGMVVFLHRVIPGSTNRSYGVHVAQLAGVPAAVVKRAQAVLKAIDTRVSTEDASKQIALFDSTPAQKSPVEARLAQLDPENLTPIEALNALDELKRLL